MATNTEKSVSLIRTSNKVFAVNAQDLTQTFVFPKAIKEINCAGVISDLGFFNGRIQKGVKKIIIADSVLENITKDPKMLADALLFKRRYPNIVVTGNKKKSKTLDEYLEIKPAKIKIDQDIIDEQFSKRKIYIDIDFSRPAKKQTPEPKEEAKPITSEYPIKTEDFCDDKELLTICANDQSLKALGLLETELKRVVRKQMLRLEKTIRFDTETNSVVCCFPRSKIPEIIKNLTKGYKTAAKSETGSEKQEKPMSQRELKKLKQPEPQKNTIMSVAIKKYIPRNLWTEICKACGKNEETQKFILETINSVNTNVPETPSSKHLQIINPATNARTNSPYMKKEFVNCVVQSITDRLYRDNKRIIWAYLPNDKILVCTGVLMEHTKTKSANEYKRLRTLASDCLNDKEELITPQKIMDEKYFDIEDLLNGNVKTFVDEQETNELKQEEKIAEIRSGKMLETEHIEQVVDEQEKPINRDNIPKDLTDVFALETYINSVIEIIDRTVKSGLEHATNEKDVVKQIEEIDDVRKVLIQKEKIQNMIPEFTKTDELLKIITTNINGTLNR